MPDLIEFQLESGTRIYVFGSQQADQHLIDDIVLTLDDLADIAFERIDGILDLGGRNRFYAFTHEMKWLIRLYI